MPKKGKKCANYPFGAPTLKMFFEKSVILNFKEMFLSCFFPSHWSRQITIWWFIVISDRSSPSARCFRLLKSPFTFKSIWKEWACEVLMILELFKKNGAPNLRQFVVQFRVPFCIMGEWGCVIIKGKHFLPKSLILYQMRWRFSGGVIIFLF